MVSLAFVISFVASAVALLIGIVIYSDISDEMAGTFEFTPEVTIPEVVQNLGQNTATSDQPIPANTTNLASIYSGLNNTNFVTEVTLSISGVSLSNQTDDWHWALMINDITTSGSITQDATLTNLNHLAGGFTQGANWFYKTFDKNEIDGEDLKISWEGTGTIHRALVKMYDGEYLPSSGLADFPPKAGCNGCPEYDPVIKDSGKLQFSTTKTSAFALTTDTVFTIDTSGSTNANDKVTIMVYYQDAESASVSTGRIGIDSIEITNLGLWDFGTNVGATLSGNTPVACTTYDPLNADSCGTNNSFLIGGGASLPLPFEIGLYDSINNLLASQSGTVTTDTPQDIVATFPSIPIPTNGQVSVGIFGDNINYLGDTTLADFDSGVTGIEDPFVSDGTSASSQRTVLQVVQQEVIIPESGGVNDQFAQADNVALTVLGVLPVALFFTLFTILSPKVDGEE